MPRPRLNRRSSMTTRRMTSLLNGSVQATVQAMCRASVSPQQVEKQALFVRDLDGPSRLRKELAASGGKKRKGGGAGRRPRKTTGQTRIGRSECIVWV